MRLDFTRFRASLSYIIRAQNAHGIHSPFVFDFYQHVWKSNSIAKLDPAIEQRRSELLSDFTEILVNDLGAGSDLTPGKKRKIADITRFSSKPTRWVLFLTRLIQHYKYKQILDLGSSLGLTTSYLAQYAAVVSVEGCSQIGNLAQKNWATLGLSVDSRIGNIDEVLPSILAEKEAFDLVILDANHRYEPTKRYVEQILNHLPEQGCLVMDDIHWSRGMEKAWLEIIQDPRISVSIDLFEMGVLFVHAKQAKQHFILR